MQRGSMTEQVNHATERSNDAAACAVNLMHHYGFDLGDYTLIQLLTGWQERYPAVWIRLATIEALYQGRYKAISVEQILALWQRRSQPIHHFNHEFERLVCADLPEELGSTFFPQREPSKPPIPFVSNLSHPSTALQLPRLDGSVAPEADVMLALRTLHSEEMAAVTEAAAIEEAPTEAQKLEVDNQPSLQTYSYTLRSDEPLSHSHGAKEPSTQNGVDPAIDSGAGAAVEAVCASEVGMSNGSGSDVSESDVNDATLLEKTGTPLSPPPENALSLTDHQVANTLSPVTLPGNNSQNRSTLSQVGSIAKILQQLEDQDLKAKALLPALGLLTPVLKPKLHLTTHYQPLWLTDPTHKQPIHQFTPTLELSAFHSKLKAVAQLPEEKTEP